MGAEKERGKPRYADKGNQAGRMEKRRGLMRDYAGKANVRSVGDASIVEGEE